VQDELQNDGDDQFICVILVEQLGENMNETHKSRGGNKLGHRPNVERSREVSRVRISCDYFSMRFVYNDIFFKRKVECIENCFSKLWKQ
jgi:hypothetical protein